MPFTPTHVVAGLPIAWLFRWRVPFLALAIGTMVPDLGIFFPKLIDYGRMHSSIGLLSHCLPIGMLAYYFYRLVLQHPLIELFPARYRLVFLGVTRPVDWRPVHLLTVSLLILAGSASHVFWDSFTHSSRWGTETFPGLTRVAFVLHDRPIAWFKVLQHGSSILFLPPMIVGGYLWARSQTPDMEQDVVRV